MLCESRVSALGQPGRSKPQKSVWFGRRVDTLVRQTGQVSRIKCPERCRHIGPNTDDALLNILPKQRDPKIAAEKQFRPVCCRRALGVGSAVNLHLFDGRRRRNRRTMPGRTMTPFMHPRVTTRVSASLDVNLLVADGCADRIFTYTQIHRSPDCADR